MINNPIKGKIIFKAEIKCESPIHIGSGMGERSDVDIILDSDGLPIIPATSFVGVLRHAFEEQFPKEFGNNPIDRHFKNFWGYTEDKDGQQSALKCSDLAYICSEYPNILNRDGICIDHERGIVKKGGKFDFEILERGSIFSLKMEFTYRKDDEYFVKKTVRTIYDLLQQQRIRLGAKTNSGLGKMEMIENESQFYLFDFTKKSGVFDWLSQNFQANAISVEMFGNSFNFTQRRFHITATLNLKNAMIVRAYSHAPELPDATQLQSGKDWVISGSSFKGAIRARAERIVNTLELQNKQKIIEDLFGIVNDTERSQIVKKGKVRIHEVILEKNDFPIELQARIKVDRFTGGVIEGGLFDSMPIFAPTTEKAIKVQIEILNYENHEAGLLLLVLKDLWSGDLAVGGEKNIGRGVFQGVHAEISWEDGSIMIGKNIGELSDDDKTKLQSFVEALIVEQG